jgi:predicted metal-binding membrane protein
MTAAVPPVDRTTLRLTPTTVTLFALAALAWAAAIARARTLGNGPGTMGMAPAAFLVMWTLMMTAMMLPAVAPVASLYAQTIRTDQARRVPPFVLGYLLVWALAGIPAYAALRVVDHVAGDSDAAMRAIAVVVLVAAGVFQLTPLKTRCLRHCRSPLAQLLHFGNIKGRARDIKVAFHHAGYCLGCCWALMLLFVTFGVMSVWAMVGLAVVVFTEKLGRHGDRLARIVGVACLILASLVVASPTIAHAVIPGTGGAAMSTHM